MFSKSKWTGHHHLNTRLQSLQSLPVTSIIGAIRPYHVPENNIIEHNLISNLLLRSSLAYKSPCVCVFIHVGVNHVLHIAFPVLVLLSVRGSRKLPTMMMFYIVSGKRVKKFKSQQKER